MDSPEVTRPSSLARRTYLSQVTWKAPGRTVPQGLTLAPGTVASSREVFLVLCTGHYVERIRIETCTVP